MRTKNLAVASRRGGGQSGAGAVEYVGLVVGVGALLAVGAVVFPEVGAQVVCKVSQAVGSLTGESVSCSGGTAGGQDQGAESAGRPVPEFVVPGRGTPGSGTSRVEFEVNVPDGENWTVVSDQPWVTVPDNRVLDGPSVVGFYGRFGGGNGSGSATAVVHANPGKGTRTATLTFTGPDGQTFTQTIQQPGQRTKTSSKTVVLGDSFSSGNGSVKGNPDPTEGDEARECYRSSNSWARVLDHGVTSDAGRPSISLTAFAACGGATVNGTSLDGKGGSSSFLDQIDANRDALAGADQVAFTIGGNDIGFSNILQPCVTPFSIDACHDSVRRGSELINGTNGQPSPLSLRLEEAYLEMLEAAPNATVYVVGYPPMVEVDDTGGGALDWFEVEPENRHEIVDLIDDFNFQIESTVNRVNRSDPNGGRLVFVDPTAPDSPFWGHSLTDDTPYYHGLDIDWKWDLPPAGAEPWSYHPNDAGNEAYARWIAEYMMGSR